MEVDVLHNLFKYHDVLTVKQVVEFCSFTIIFWALKARDRNPFGEPHSFVQ